VGYVEGVLRLAGPGLGIRRRGNRIRLCSLRTRHGHLRALPGISRASVLAAGAHLASQLDDLSFQLDYALAHMAIRPMSLTIADQPLFLPVRTRRAARNSR